MSDATVGDLARFLEANPGWHRVGDHMVKHITTINNLVDRNKTMWQRIQSVLEPTEGRRDADRLATLLHPAVIAELADAARKCDCAPARGTRAGMTTRQTIRMVMMPDVCDCADPHPPCTECDGGFCYTVEHCTDCLTPYDPPYQPDRLREFEE